jgi:hypothetical protein
MLPGGNLTPDVPTPGPPADPRDRQGGPPAMPVARPYP